MDSDDERGKKKKKAAPEFDLDLDERGYPILPEEYPTSGNEMKALMREYITICWSECFASHGFTTH